MRFLKDAGVLAGEFMDLHPRGRDASPAELRVDVDQGGIEQGVAPPIAMGEREEGDPARVGADVIPGRGVLEESPQPTLVGEDPRRGLLAGRRRLRSLRLRSPARTTSLSRIYPGPNRSRLPRWPASLLGSGFRLEAQGVGVSKRTSSRDLLARCQQLLGHLVRHDPPERQAAQEIRALRLDGADLGDIRRRPGPPPAGNPARSP